MLLIQALDALIQEIDNHLRKKLNPAAKEQPEAYIAQRFLEEQQRIEWLVQDQKVEPATPSLESQDPISDLQKKMAQLQISTSPRMEFKADLALRIGGTWQEVMELDLATFGQKVVNLKTEALEDTKLLIMSRLKYWLLKYRREALELFKESDTLMQVEALKQAEALIGDSSTSQTEPNPEEAKRPSDQEDLGKQQLEQPKSRQEPSDDGSQHGSSVREAKPRGTPSHSEGSKKKEGEDGSTRKSSRRSKSRHDSDDSKDKSEGTSKGASETKATSDTKGDSEPPKPIEGSRNDKAEEAGPSPAKVEEAKQKPKNVFEGAPCIDDQLYLYVQQELERALAFCEHARTQQSVQIIGNFTYSPDVKTSEETLNVCKYIFDNIYQFMDKVDRMLKIGPGRTPRQYLLKDFLPSYSKLADPVVMTHYDGFCYALDNLDRAAQKNRKTWKGTFKETIMSWSPMPLVTYLSNSVRQYTDKSQDKRDQVEECFKKLRDKHIQPDMPSEQLFNLALESIDDSYSRARGEYGKKLLTMYEDLHKRVMKEAPEAVFIDHRKTQCLLKNK